MSDASKVYGEGRDEKSNLESAVFHGRIQCRTAAINSF